MSWHVAFLLRITEGESRADRLVYADWLEEQGEPLGELVRVQADLLALGSPDPRRGDLARRERKLLKRHQVRWRKLGESLAPWPEARRCFEERILTPSGEDPDAFLCPTCGETRIWRWDLRHPEMLNWVINPGVAVNELVLGQRLPRV